MTMHEDQQKDLLDTISHMGSQGRAEGEDKDRLPRTFWPVPEHLRAFDPDVVLVVGPRGAGKTELFRTVIEMGLLPDMAARLPQVRLPPMGPQQTRWLAGYPIGTEFPGHLLLQKFARDSQAMEDLFLDVWLAYLIRVLESEISDDSLRPIFAPAGGDIGAVVAAFRTTMQPALLALDRLDERLRHEDRYLFIAYDELDTLARGDSEIIRAAVRGLVGLWATQTRRWRRIRGRVFLRTDLYERAASAGGADFAKLAANRTELSWSDRDLYSMLVRRFANSGDKLGTYCRVKIALESDPKLGLFPTVKQATDVRPLVERMVGTYMGANERKGLTFRWLLDHIRDGRGQALPRPLVRLLEAAAEGQKGSGTLPRWPRLIEPRALRRALDKVSEEHVVASLDEWPWLEGLKGRLSTISAVPWDRREINRQFEKTWEEPWVKGQTIGPPVGTVHDLVDYLVEVGIFRARHLGRLDVPDLFLAGLGLNRKGGVRKK
ncbi:MAG: hypothetical protein ACT4P2_16770 [Pseudomonadota bacterium]